MITQDRAVEIAKEESEKNGHFASDYTISIETYYADEQQWIVWFERKGAFKIPGGKHAILVHKTTGQTVFMPGE